MAERCHPYYLELLFFAPPQCSAQGEGNANFAVPKAVASPDRWGTQGVRWRPKSDDWPSAAFFVRMSLLRMGRNRPTSKTPVSPGNL